MRKALPDSTTPPKAASGRGYWVCNPSADPEEAVADRPRPSGKARFLEPYRLSTEQRAALIALLSTQSVGDADSRDLFATALEYNLAGCRQSEPSQPQDPVATHPPGGPASGLLEELAEMARELERRLAGLDTPTRLVLFQALRTTDSFARGHDAAYLDALGRELRHLAEAADIPLSATITPPIPELTRRFVRRVADAYEACFETKPQTEPDSPFITTLRLLAPEAGISLPAEVCDLAALLPSAESTR